MKPRSWSGALELRGGEAGRKAGRLLWELWDV